MVASPYIKTFMLQNVNHICWCFWVPALRISRHLHSNSFN